MENDNNDNKIYGKVIRDLRKKNNLTQDQVAQMTGFDTKYISQIENGKYMGTIRTMLIFCKTFKVTPNEILYNFFEKFNIKQDLDTFSSSFSKLSVKDRKNVLSLIESMLSEW